jgi:hypothetical protein
MKDILQIKMKINWITSKFYNKNKLVNNVNVFCIKLKSLIKWNQNIINDDKFCL